MSNSYFQFKQFTIQQDRCAMKVTTDGCLFGGMIAAKIENRKMKIENTLDIGTGTGLLALMYAQKNSKAIIDAIEIDKDAAEQANENISASKWKDRINITHADARTFHFTKKYDLIISNPPFYEKELRSSDSQKNIAHHSDELSLQELLAIIKNNLKPDGQFFLLLPDKRLTDAETLLNKNQLIITQMTMVRQSVNHDFFRVIVRGKHKNTENRNYEKDEISIWNDKQKYTPEFVTLLKDYYLNL